MASPVPEIHLFRGGPFPGLRRFLSVLRSDDRRTGRRACLAVLIGWLPLVILNALETLLLERNVSIPFLLDFGLHARYLVAVPLLIRAESRWAPQIEQACGQFLSAGLIREADRAAFLAAVSAGERRLRSKPAEILAIVAALGLSIGTVIASPTVTPHGPALLAAGWWHALVSRPLLLILSFGWFWRQAVWGMFLWRVSRFDLRLVPAHPDRRGGLAFLGGSLFAYAEICLAFGVVLAGSIAGRVFFYAESLGEFQWVPLAAVAIVLGVCAGPLLPFMRNLRRARWRGALEYGALVNTIGLLWERKWIDRKPEEDPLAAPDFSAVVDLYQTASIVNEMGLMPFRLQNLTLLVVAVLAPFVLFAFAAAPVNLTLLGLAKLLLG